MVYNTEISASINLDWAVKATAAQYTADQLNEEQKAMFELFWSRFYDVYKDESWAAGLPTPEESEPDAP